MELVRSSLSIVSGLPCEKVRSAPAFVVSGPAQRSLSLWPARSRSRLATLSIESSDSFVASTAVSIATGWNEPVPGRELHPLKSSAFHGALLRQLRLSRIGCFLSGHQSIQVLLVQNPPVENDCSHTFEVANVVQRIGIEKHEIGNLPSLNRPKLTLHS